jgi:hypothetical protein
MINRKMYRRSALVFHPVKTLIVLGAALALTLTAVTAKANTIVNINATANGEQTGGVNCSIACEGALIDPVQVTLGPGTYIFNDAWSPTGGLEAGALYDAWNFEAGNPVAWAWHWKVFRDDGSDGSTINPDNYNSFILADVDSTEAFPTEYAAAVFGAATPPTVLTFTHTTTLDFVVNDYYLPDNAGGVSLDISKVSSTPEPASLLLILTGAAGVGARLRGRKS